MVRLILCLATLAIALAAPLRADVRLPALFADGMVLQQAMEVPVWGWADPGEKVVVSVNGREAAGIAGPEGRWQVKLAASVAGGPFELRVAGKTTRTVKNVWFGEVWLCSGQSNMEMAVKDAANAEQEIPAANYPLIREFRVKHVIGEKALPDTEGAWIACTPTTAPVFSAAAYFFGREVHLKQGVAVGLIHTSWGGSLVEAWTDYEVLRALPEAKPIVERWDKVMEAWPAQFARYEKQVADYDKQIADGKAKLAEMGLTPEQAATRFRAPAEPRRPMGPGNIYQPGGLYNGMLAPLMPYGLRGVVWYQGESNRDRGYQYRALFPAMIRSWRQAWGQGDFPFLFVQLPNFMEIQQDPAESELAELREAQLLTLALPKTGMAVTIDIGDSANIHPKDKQTVGKRLARAAVAVAYGQDGEFSGPLFQEMKIENGKARLAFTHVGGGLEARGGPLRGFAIAGEDRKFVWADAVLDGNAVVVSSDRVASPVAVRYAWADNPICNLGNRDGLPASPFRTDAWRVGPVFKRMAPEKDKPALRVWFARVGAGELRTHDGEAIHGFQIAGEDRKFVAGTAKFLDPSSVLVWSDQVGKPVAVRYAWKGDLESPNILNTEGLEAVPFRTDDWPAF